MARQWALSHWQYSREQRLTEKSIVGQRLDFFLLLCYPLVTLLFQKTMNLYRRACIKSVSLEYHSEYRKGRAGHIALWNCSIALEQTLILGANEWFKKKSNERTDKINLWAVRDIRKKERSNSKSNFKDRPVKMVEKQRPIVIFSIDFHQVDCSAKRKDD